MGANWFIGLPVPSEDWWHRVPPAPDRVRTFAPEDLHITVAFLGPVPQRAAEAAFELADEWPRGGIEITLGAVVAMGNPRRPSALSAKVSGGAVRLGGIMAGIREGMWQRAGAAPDTRPPLPHVTLARPSRSAGKGERRAALEWAAAIDLGAPRVTLTRLVLYTHAEDRRLRLFREHASVTFKES